MFEYGSDISVFHGILISLTEKAEEFLTEINIHEIYHDCGRNLLHQFKNEEYSKENTYHLLKKEHCTKIAHLIVKAFYEIYSELELNCSSSNNESLHRRIHASALFATMNLHQSGDYDGYFESLTGVFPSISWCLYFELVKAFQWNRYCIECITTLPMDITSKLVEMAIRHFEEEPLDNDTFLLDCCIEVIFEQSYTYVHHFISSKENISKNMDQEQNEILHNVPQEVSVFALDCMVKCIVQCICSLWTSVYDTEAKSNLIKVSFRTLLTFFKHVKNSKYKDVALNFIELNSDKTVGINNNELCKRLYDSSVKKNEILGLLQHTGGVIKEACKILTSNKGTAFIRFMFEEFDKTHSWEIVPFGSLFYQFVQYLKDFISICSVEFQEEFQPIASSIKEISLILDKHASETNVWLSEVHRLQLWSTDISLHKYHAMMGYIMGQNKSLIEECVLEFLERNTDLLCKSEYIITLMEIVLNCEVLQKERITKIFFNTFQKLEAQEQKMFLNIILECHGIVEVFKMSDFNTHLVHFLNQIVKEEKLISKIQLQVLPLCFQSPYDVIRQIIMQAMKNKGGIPALTQILKIVSFICNYKNDPNSSSLFIKCFCDVIKNEVLSKQQKENSIALIKTLIKCKSENKYEIISPEDVLIWCILPYLQVSVSTDLLDYSLDLLQILITQVKFWSEKVRKIGVVWCLFQALEYYTVQRNGEKRQMIIATINSLMSKDIVFTEKDINWLGSHIKDANPAWHLWFECRFFHKVIEQEKLKRMPIMDILIGNTFGLTKELSSAIIQEKLMEKSPDLRYSYLIISLSKVLLYSMENEWIFCFDTITASVADLQIMPIMSSFTNDIARCNKNLSKAFHCFTDALILLNSTDLSNIPWHYIISCFSKVVKHAFDEVENDNVFTVCIFCEICRLANVIDMNYTAEIVVPLLDIARLCKDIDFSEEHLRLILLNAMDTISSVDAFENLKKILNQMKV